MRARICVERIDKYKMKKLKGLCLTGLVGDHMGALSLAGPDLGCMVCPLRACKSDITHLAGRRDLLDFFGSSEMFVGSLFGTCASRLLQTLTHAVHFRSLRKSHPRIATLFLAQS